MKPIWLSLMWAALLLVSGPGTLPLRAQQSGADSARVLLDASRLLQAKGETDLARELLRVLRARWPDSPAAQEAGGLLTLLPEAPVSGLSRTGFIAYHTGLGAWLGIAIPAALGAEGPGPYGVGLLVGAPAGFIGSRAFARKHALTDGQAGIITLASEFGMWQALGWRSQLDIGNHQVCSGGDLCHTESSGRAPFTASILGAALGETVGVIASKPGVSSGTASLVSSSAHWGTWFGLAAAVLADADNGAHGALSAALIGGDLGIALAIPVAHTWHPSASRVRLISAGGLAGGLAGLGISLLTSAKGGKTVMGLVVGGNVAGMVAAGSLSRESTNHSASRGEPTSALLTIRDDVRWGLPTPMPTVITLKHPVALRERAFALRIGLFDAEF